MPSNTQKHFSWTRLKQNEKKKNNNKNFISAIFQKVNKIPFSVHTTQCIMKSFDQFFNEYGEKQMNSQQEST